MTHLELTNVRGFADAKLDFRTADGDVRKVTMLVGRNGTGKSTLLRTIAIGLCDEVEASALKAELAGEFIRQNKRGVAQSEARIVVGLSAPDRSGESYEITTTVTRDSSGREILRKEAKRANDSPSNDAFPWDGVFVCGYGVNRGPRSRTPPANYTRRDALLSLFSDAAPLIDAEVALQRFQLAQFQARSKVCDDVVRHLKVILELNPNHKIDIGPARVLVHGPWGAMPFHALGDGYRGTAGWVLDFLSALMQVGQLHSTADPSGIVLIDEIDEHIHPSWQRSLLPTLRKRFPKVQFVGTTHSAMTLVNLQREELALCTLRNAVAQVFQGEFRGPGARTADELLRSEWFGLQSTLDQESAALIERYQEALRTGGPSTKKTGKLREEVRERLGHPVASPLDELAVQIADELRKELRADNEPDEREKLIKQGATMLRERLEKLKRGDA
ncbi:MAG: AAA family ATPase [Polyangiaceae bacterium]